MRQDEYRAILSRVPRKISSLRAVTHIAVDAALWASILYCRSLNRGWFYSAVEGILFAMFCFRSFGMMHDCVHLAGARNRKWNDRLGRAYGLFCFLPFSGWRQLHLDHHRWTGNVEKGPSAKILLDFEKAGFQTSNLVSFS